MRPKAFISLLVTSYLVATADSAASSRKAVSSVERHLLRRDSRDGPASATDQNPLLGLMPNISAAADAPNMSVSASETLIKPSVQNDVGFETRMSFEDACKDIVSFLKQSSRLQTFKSLGPGLSGMREDAVLLLGTEHVLCQLDNFLLHGQTANPDRRFLVASLDDKVYEFCKELRRPKLTCLDLRHWIPDVNESNPHNIRSNNAGFMTCLYKMIVWSKPVLLTKVLDALPPEVLVGVFDADVVLTKGPDGDILDWARKNWKPEWRLLAGTDTDNDSNTGSVIGFATEETRAMAETWVTHASDAPHPHDFWGDQNGFNNMNRDNRQANASFWKNKVYNMPWQVLGQHGHMGPYGCHFNMVSVKAESMRKLDVWKPTYAGCESPLKK